jgi:hypothetical protein
LGLGLFVCFLARLIIYRRLENANDEQAAAMIEIIYLRTRDLPRNHNSGY